MIIIVDTEFYMSVQRRTSYIAKACETQTTWIPRPHCSSLGPELQVRSLFTSCTYFGQQPPTSL